MAKLKRAFLTLLELYHLNKIEGIKKNRYPQRGVGIAEIQNSVRSVRCNQTYQLVSVCLLALLKSAHSNTPQSCGLLLDDCLPLWF